MKRCDPTESTLMFLPVVMVFECDVFFIFQSVFVCQSGDSLTFWTQQTQPAGRCQAGSLQSRQRLGGSHRQEEEVHGWRSTQPGRPGERTHLLLPAGYNLFSVSRLNVFGKCPSCKESSLLTSTRSSVAICIEINQHRSNNH